ncbi:hypothetical protein Jiend_46450 [Micromonospora endophytica]|uniref:hypothetical protein n=1 Tax=Micromonospora endophytica TaxID=515350 RepID=UPI001C32BF53|nr:hypothetical protein [Micromonospora endophytica]BCJ61223.1 hypothetical protein Jiend_46450 [Micromonospora endophytica]
MSTFEEYAALARHLASQQRAGEQGAAAEAQRRRDLDAAVASLDHRLTAQGQRLDQLGHTIGVTPGTPAPPPPGPHLSPRRCRVRRSGTPARDRNRGPGRPAAQPPRRGGRKSGRTPSRVDRNRTARCRWR